MTMAESSRPKPANGGVPTAGRILLVAGGEETGTVAEAVPALAVRAEEPTESGQVATADVIAFNTSGAPATAYTSLPVFGTPGDAQAFLDASEPAERSGAANTPARRVLCAFWPDRS